MNAIYELVDTTDDETYYPLGVFSSLRDALAALRLLECPWRLSDQNDWEYCRLEIRERPIGFGREGKLVWRKEWKCEPDEDDVDGRWVEVEDEV